MIERRRLPPPAASTVYELTETGAALGPVLAALAQWGARTLGPPPEIPTRTGWLEKALRTAVVAFAPRRGSGSRSGTRAPRSTQGSPWPGLLADADATVTGDAGRTSRARRSATSSRDDRG